MVFQYGWRNGVKIQPSTEGTELLRQSRVLCIVCNSGFSHCYNINSTCIKWIKAMFQAKKGSKNTRLKGMDEFLQAEFEADPTGAAGHREKHAKNLVKNAHKESQSILNLNLLRLAQLRRRHDENL